jgi:hypothetical protein
VLLSSCCDQDVRRLPESRRLPVLALPPRDGRALLRLVGVFGGIAMALVKYVAQGARGEANGVRAGNGWGERQPRRVQSTKNGASYRSASTMDVCCDSPKKRRQE